MSVIQLNEGSCVNCYKCIRECPIKAIEFKDGRANIIEDECVLCGTCVLTCPQGAKVVKNEVPGVKQLIQDGRKVYITLAPSWVGWFDCSFAQLSAAFKKIGFAGVEETAIGAAEVSREYASLMQNGYMNNIIATACSSVVMLVERHFPELVKMLAPISSPMMAHARIMREMYGDIKVVFVGPCLSKKFEASDPLAGGLVNYALTFPAIEEWMREEGVDPHTIEPDPDAKGVSEPVSRLYPTASGILKTIGDESYHNYKPVAVDGLDRCLELFSALRDGEVQNLFVEANICAGSCIGGPIMRMHKKRTIVTAQKIGDTPMPQDVSPAPTSLQHMPHPRVFSNRAVKNDMPTEEQIREILARTGKTTKEQELNCGSCGYPSCRAKAIAVFQGKADINMCLPFLRQRAENLSTMVIEHSPNAIIALDDDLFVQDLNPLALTMLGQERSDVIGMPLPMFFGETDFDKCKEEGVPAVKKYFSSDIGKSVEQTILYIPEHRMYLVFIKDITEEEERKKQLVDMRDSTVDIAQKVIEKQMVVAQEIASLLGETTAETKVALTNLKKTMGTISED